MPLPMNCVSVISSSFPGPRIIVRGRSKPVRNSSTVKPAGTLSCAPAGRSITFD